MNQLIDNNPGPEGSESAPFAVLTTPCLYVIVVFIEFISFFVCIN
jgi:hypothetical protein